MPRIPRDLNGVMNAAGLKASAVDRIRLSRGVVGRATYVAGGVMGVFAVIAWGMRSDTPNLLWLALLTLVAFALYFGGVLWFAHKHPGEALLEGAELIQWRQMEMASKDSGVIARGPLQEPPILIAKPDGRDGR